MGAYLVDHPPRRSQFRASRREREAGVVVVHTAENAPDYVAFDGGAEAVAEFIRTRADAGSYHELVDSDSSILMVPDQAEAFGDGTGSNRFAWHLSIATRADVWPLAPKAWRDGAIEQAAQAAARYARRLHARTGIVIPARRISRSESELRIPGFISHGERDPGRRHDPGAHFPWEAFLARYAELTRDLGNHQEDDDMTPEQARLLVDISDRLARVEKRVGVDNDGADLSDELDLLRRDMRRIGAAVGAEGIES